MLILCGFSLSNYYNKVKLALLEKQVPFVEELANTGKAVTDLQLESSPLGKIPYLKLEEGSLCESQVMMDYIEARYPTPALISADPWTAAKTRELTTFLELHLELVVRDLYPAAFFGGTISDANKERVFKHLTRNISAFRRLARFAPYVGGDTFTQADCAAFVHFPVIGLATKIIYGNDMLQEAGIDWKPYVQLISERPSAQRVNADRKAYQASLAKTA